ncbi:phosphoserine phosphatase SerB [Bogoriella caseilytica]|uniref:phosphoserine phosphatase n=1 Tax=Bogoriella caseilytica TaxID=56055 RepID=A0A3N2BGA5_9MICO|nr:phosphoserine phosphatase SerB [Bogoriella caseilytica]ROR74260.1 phosphoserine phosphatase [Bogoriella caseilytica]
MTSLRLSLISPRPLPETLAAHAYDLMSEVVSGDLQHSSSNTDFSAMAISGQARPGVDLDTLRAELRSPAIAVGVDAAVVSGELATAPPSLVITDVDSTLITAEVIELLAEHAGRRAEVAEVTERAMRGELDFAASLRERVAALAGLPVRTVDQVRAAVQLMPGARELLSAVRATGGRFGVVSGGFMELLEPLAAELGIDHVAANRLEVADGVLTGRVRGPIVDRAAKAEYLRAWAQADGIPVARTMAIGDGANDLDMLHAAGLGVAFCAKPVVVAQAPAAVTFPRLDAALAFTGAVSGT